MAHELMNRLIDLLQDIQKEQGKYMRPELTRLIFKEVGKWSKLHLYFAADFAAFLSKRGGIKDEAWHKNKRRFGKYMKYHEDFLSILWEFQSGYTERLYNNCFNLWSRGPEGFGKCFFHTHEDFRSCYND